MSLLLLLILHSIELALSFLWKRDMIDACQDDLSVLVPSNSSTIQVAYDPNAPTKKQVDEACVQAVNVSLFWTLFDFLVFKLIFYFYFGTVVSTYSKELLEPPLATDKKIGAGPSLDGNKIS
ncbi:8715_t:CDS:2 [Funneliformis caledonium]|uniref:8715_t:CDS:1 n=2 Tax=Funneliformis TaxID=1117308 RepID=A0A9N8VUN7_9GLOM|nr:8715_t:CDS:2 [Funneliformis caledonium]